MRGAAPLLVALASLPLLGERLHPAQDVAVVLIGAGAVVMRLAQAA